MSAQPCMKSMMILTLLSCQANFNQRRLRFLKRIGFNPQHQRKNGYFKTSIIAQCEKSTLKVT